MSSLRNWGRRQKLVLHRFRPLGVMLSAALEHICASEPENVCTLLSASPNKLARRSSEPAASRSNLPMTDDQDFQVLPPSATHSESTSLMRACQPAPVPLKYATTFITHDDGSFGRPKRYPTLALSHLVDTVPGCAAGLAQSIKTTRCATRYAPTPARQCQLNPVGHRSAANPARHDIRALRHRCQ